MRPPSGATKAMPSWTASTRVRYLSSLFLRGIAKHTLGGAVPDLPLGGEVVVPDHLARRLGDQPVALLALPEGRLRPIGRDRAPDALRHELDDLALERFEAAGPRLRGAEQQYPVDLVLDSDGRAYVRLYPKLFVQGMDAPVVRDRSARLHHGGAIGARKRPLVAGLEVQLRGVDGADDVFFVLYLADHASGEVEDLAPRGQVVREQRPGTLVPVGAEAVQLAQVGAKGVEHPALLQDLLLGPLPLCDVAGRGEDQVPPAVVHGAHVHLDGERGAVLAAVQTAGGAGRPSRGAGGGGA